MGAEHKLLPCRWEGGGGRTAWDSKVGDRSLWDPGGHRPPSATPQQWGPELTPCHLGRSTLGDKRGLDGSQEAPALSLQHRRSLLQPLSWGGYGLPGKAALREMLCFLTQWQNKTSLCPKGKKKALFLCSGSVHSALPVCQSIKTSRAESRAGCSQGTSLGFLGCPQLAPSSLRRVGKNYFEATI